MMEIGILGYPPSFRSEYVLRDTEIYLRDIGILLEKSGISSLKNRDIGISHQVFQGPYTAP